MTTYDDIYEIAEDNYGLVTRDQALSMGISDKELSRLSTDGRLTRIGHGVYRVKHHTPGRLDPYAESVAMVGSEAYLFGESVIAMFSLCPTNPMKIYVASPKRVRKRLPGSIKVVWRSGAADVTEYEGIPSQRVPDAIRSCIGQIMPERLVAAVEEAERQGILLEGEAETLKEEVAV